MHSKKARLVPQCGSSLGSDSGVQVGARFESGRSSFQWEPAVCRFGASHINHRALQLRGATAVAAAAGLSGLARSGPLPLPLAAVSRWPHHRAAPGSSRTGWASGPESQLAVENE